MSRSKIHSDGISVPFKWERKPGISKVSSEIESEDNGVKKGLLDDLPPPPYHVKKKPLRVGKQGKSVAEDPFVLAFKECTKSKGNSGEKKFKGRFGVIRKSLWRASCKQSVDVRDDALITSYRD